MDIELENLTRTFPGGTRGLDACWARIPSGAAALIVGPSGSGKTTLLRVIAGLDFPSSGRVRMDGRDMAGVPPHLRDVVMVLQDAPLYPHLDVEGNLRFALQARSPGGGFAWLRSPKTRAARTKVMSARVEAVLSRLDLEGCRSQRPDSLSGGQRQRAAIGRALVVDPAVHLLDEPMSDLDSICRASIREALGQVHARGRTLVQVTHEVAAMADLADWILVMRAGRVVQEGPLDDVLRSPADVEVGRLLESSVAGPEHARDDALPVDDG